MTATDPTTVRTTGTSSTSTSSARTSGTRVSGTARQVADTVAGAAGEMADRIPEVTQTTRDAVVEVNRLAHRGSDETLKLVGAMSVGVAVGLLVGGANRLLVLASLAPAALVGATLMERNDRGATSRTG